MKTARRWILIVIAAIVSQSCAVYKVRDQSRDDSKPRNEAECYPKFALSVSSIGYTNTLGSNPTNEAMLAPLRQQYVESTKKVLNSKGCVSAYTTDDSEADMVVQIKRQMYMSALPQEWLTGLSFGLIPSWGTRPNQFLYRFENRKAGSTHTYAVDLKTYNHLFLLPIGFATAKNAEEFHVYEKTLAQYTMEF